MVFEHYEAFKRTYKDTADVCANQGFTFTPMVVEAHSGAWSPSARQVWDRCAKAQSSAWNENGEASSLRIAQRLAFALHRENARAILRRMQSLEDAPSHMTGWESMAAEP